MRRLSIELRAFNEGQLVSTNAKLLVFRRHTSGLKHCNCLTRYEEAFNVALNQNDVALVAWICSQVSPHTVLGTSPPLLSQHTLLSLLHHLGHDLSQVPPTPLASHVSAKRRQV